MTQIQQGYVQSALTTCYYGHRKEMKLKLSCVLDFSPICLTKIRIKMLMSIYYRCSVAVKTFSKQSDSV